MAVLAFKDILQPIKTGRNFDLGFDSFPKPRISDLRPNTNVISTLETGCKIFETGCIICETGCRIFKYGCKGPYRLIFFVTLNNLRLILCKS